MTCKGEKVEGGHRGCFQLGSQRKGVLLKRWVRSYMAIEGTRRGACPAKRTIRWQPIAAFRPLCRRCQESFFEFNDPPGAGWSFSNIHPNVPAHGPPTSSAFPANLGFLPLFTSRIPANS